MDSVTVEGDSLEKELLRVDASLQKEGGGYLQKLAWSMHGGTCIGEREQDRKFEKKRNNRVLKTPSTIESNYNDDLNLSD